jgi:hypothetical protein
MAQNANEHTQLLSSQGRRLSAYQQEADAQSIISSHLSKQEQLLSDTAVGERLPYNDYTTIDWLHDLVRHYQMSAQNPGLSYHRSKTRFADERSTLAKD